MKAATKNPARTGITQFLIIAPPGHHCRVFTIVVLGYQAREVVVGSVVAVVAVFSGA